MHAKIISASILSANFANLGQDVQNALDAGIEQIHFDVMDHHFVPNLSFGAVICKALREHGITAPIDVHLMVENPQNYIEPFAKAGANLLTFHPETVDDVSAVISEIKSSGLQAGLAFNPDKPVNVDDAILRELDMVLLMSVFPGFGGQQFIDESLGKITKTREQLTKANSSARLGVDGGIKVENIKSVADAGADLLVVGSGFFAASDYGAQARALKQG